MKKLVQLIVLTSLLVVCASSVRAQTTYEYDGLYRLVRVTYDDGSAILFEYDAVGNRTMCIMNPETDTVYLDVRVEPPASGAVSRNPNLTWYPLDGTVTLTIAVEGTCTFVEWTGDVPEGKELDNPLILVPEDYLYPYMRITAHFDSPWGGMDADCNSNGIPDGCEGYDCNVNNVLDTCDIAGGTSDDYDLNGVPDECEDCNENGVPDACDLPDGCATGDCANHPNGCGASDDCQPDDVPDECQLGDTDCNGNDVPDECDLAEGTSEDCNNNDVPDDCDIAAGTSEDCNDNDTPDECDIDDGTSEDTNGNGIPDECDADCNTNGIPDFLDIADCQGEPWCGDCNNNGIPDECDIAEGSSMDCNGNEIPDECDIAGGTSEDCQPDEIPDECQVAGGATPVIQPVGDGGTVELSISGACGMGLNYSTQQTISNPMETGAGDQIQDGFSEWWEDCMEWDPYTGECLWWEYWTFSASSSASYYSNGKIGSPVFTFDVTAGYSAESNMDWSEAESSVETDLTFICHDPALPPSAPVFLTVTALGGGYLSGWADSSYTLSLTSADGLLTLNEERHGGGSYDWGQQTSNHGSLLLENGQSVTLHFAYAGSANNWSSGNVYMTVSLALVSDCNSNSVPDECDILIEHGGYCEAGFGTCSTDYDLDGLPDECNPDCDTNGVPDACDLDCDTGNCDSHPLGCGTNDDYDLNGVPDECDPDCNGNGVPDTCDLDCDTGNCASNPNGCGTAADCQPNGIPDECDLDPSDPDGNGEISQDCQPNGIPDECEIYMVCPDGSGDYLAIQDAIDAASDGYTITLCDGAFTGDGNRDIDFLGKAITVRSQSGIPENCIIDCEGAARGFYFHSGEGAGSLLTGITIRNGHVDDGAGIYCAFSSPTIENCVIANNSANIEGGGMYCESASPALANCLFYANSSGQHGGALGCSDSSPTLVNCTLSGNWANTEGGGIYVDSSSPILTNCILWADTPDEIYIASSDPNDPGDPNDPNDPGDPNDVAVTYSDVEGGWPGDGNIDANPFFVDPSGENCHLGSLSPCIDTGDANSDFSLESEPDGGRINMGAYGNTPEAATKGWIYIEGYNLVSHTRVGRTVFDYELTATVRNASDQTVTNVVVEMLDAPDNVEIFDGIVDVGDVPAGAVVVSEDTFTIRADRTTLISQLPISWQITYTGGGGLFTTLLDPETLEEPPSEEVPSELHWEHLEIRLPS